MQRRLVGYFLLSFLSFCFFTGIFLVLANTQVSAAQPTVQKELVQSTDTAPTPTMYFAPTGQPVHEDAIQRQQTASPTPTVFAQQPQVLATNIQKQQVVMASPTPLPTETPTPTVVPTTQPTTATDLDTLFARYSSQYNVSADELKKIAQCESGFNTNSDTGLYAGMFQFSASTWASTRNAMGLDPNPELRKDAEESIKTTAFMLARGQENAWPNCH
jgi:Transglycosylase-like domain